MGVEGGSISVGGPSIGGGAVGVGSAISVGPSVGISAPSMEGGPVGGFSPSFVNEGPMAPGFLENTMPLTLNNFKPLGEIIFNPEPTPSVVSQAEEVAAAAWEVTEPVAKVPTAVGSLVNPAETSAPQGVSLEASVEQFIAGYSQSRSRLVVTTPVAPDVIQAQRTKTALEAAGMVDLSKKVVTFVHPEVKGVVKEQQIEQEMEEEEILTDNRLDEMLEREDKRIEEERISHTEDEQAALQRVREIIAASIKVGYEGQKIASLIYEHHGNRSQELNIVDPDMQLTDGSLELIREELPTKQFSSLTDVAKNARELVSKHKAVKRGDKGKKVADQDMAKVYRKSPTLIHPAEMVFKRSEEKKEEVRI